MVRSSLAFLLATAALAGCGADEQRAESTTSPPRISPPAAGAKDVRCSQARAAGYRLCAHAYGTAPNVPATIQRRHGGSWRVLAAGPPGTVHDGVQIGHWAQAWLSPDGTTLLAQWSAECEVPIAFFVDAWSGTMRPVTGEKIWSEAPQSVAIGWAADGRARVRLPDGACGSSAAEPGVYLIDPESKRLTREARG